MTILTPTKTAISGSDRDDYHYHNDYHHYHHHDYNDDHDHQQQEEEWRGVEGVGGWPEGVDLCESPICGFLRDVSLSYSLATTSTTDCGREGRAWEDCPTSES